MALAVASEALDFSNAVLGQVGEAPTAAPQQSRSFINHWPAATASMSCLIVTISTIALGILGNAVVSIPLGIATIGCAIVAVYLRNSSASKDLNSYLQVLAQQLTKISGIARQFKDENGMLAKTEKDFEAAAKLRSDLFKRQKEATTNTVTGLRGETERLEAAVKEREKSLADEKAAARGALEQLTQTNTQLDQTVKAREQQIQAEKAEAAKAMSGLSAVSEQLQQVRNEKTEIEQILNGSHERLSDMTSKIALLSSVNAGINTSSDKLAQELFSIQAIRTEFQASITSLQQEGGALAEKKKAANDLVVKIYGLVENVMQMLVEVKKKKEELDTGLASMQALNKQLADQASSSKTQTDAMHDNIQKLGDLSRLVDLLPLDSPKPTPLGTTIPLGRPPEGGAASQPPAAAPTGGRTAVPIPTAASTVDRAVVPIPTAAPTGGEAANPHEKKHKKKKDPPPVQPAILAAQPAAQPGTRP